MGAQNSRKRCVMSPRTLKRQLSEFVLKDAKSPTGEHVFDEALTQEQVSVVKRGPEVLYDNEAIMTDEEGDEGVQHTPLSPNALSWVTETTPSAKSIHCDAEAYRILSGREDSVTVSEVSISRPPTSPEPELQISLSPCSDIGEGFFPPTPRGCNTPRSRNGTICTPTDVRRLSATQNMEMDLQLSPKGARLSRRGGLCAFHEYQVPESIRSIRTHELYDFGGSLCPEGEWPTHQPRPQSYDGAPRAIESISSELLTPPHRTLRRTLNGCNFSHCSKQVTFEVGGSRIPI